MFIKKSEYEALKESLENQRQLKLESIEQLLVEKQINAELRRQLEVYKSKERKNESESKRKEHAYALLCYEKAIEEMQNGNYENSQCLMELFERYEYFKYIKDESKEALL